MSVDSDSVAFLAYVTPHPEPVPAGTVLAWIDEFRTQGYVVTDGYAHPWAAPDNVVDDPAALESLAHQVSTGPEGLHFWKPSFEFTLALLVDDDENGDGCRYLLQVEVDTLYGPDNTAGEANSLAVIDAVATAVRICPPVFGALCGVYDSPPYAEDVHGGDISTLYPITYWGRDLPVATITRQRLLSSPAWRTEEISGGVLLVPSLAAVHEVDTDAMDAVREHLGWETSGYPE
jgi:hypothetical protein